VRDSGCGYDSQCEAVRQGANDVQTVGCKSRLFNGLATTSYSLSLLRNERMPCPDNLMIVNNQEFLRTCL
jgi:hypothetical protein